MGHVRLGSLPQSKRWQEVVALIQDGASVAKVADATVHAAEAGLNGVGKDQGVVATVWRLIGLPHAARSPDLDAALGRLGLEPPRRLTALSLAAALSDAIDAALPNNRGRTDLGEMAQMAAVETVAGVVGERARGLFDPSPDEVRAALAGLASARQFDHLARAFFARLAYKAVDYYLSRALAGHVGAGRRFLTLARLDEFSAALEAHCVEACGILTNFCGEWASKERFEQGEVSPEGARDFAHGAMAKLTKELKRRAGHDVH